MSHEENPWKVTPYKLTAGEAYMSPQQLEHFRQILLQRKSALMLEVDHTIHDLQVAEAEPDPNDRASQEEIFNFELKTRDRERKLISKIDAILQKIDEHDYGNCTTCDAKIGIRRLEARPTAEKCIDCKTLEEIGEKRNATINSEN